MWKLLLLGASLLSAQETSVECTASRTAQTPAVRGPAGVSAVLKFSGLDDQSKHSHDCVAQYQLAVQQDGGGAVTIAVILTSYGDAGRKLSLHLDGFTPDGKRVFGIISESGRAPDSTLFDYNTADGKVQLFDIAKARRQIPTSKCGTEAAVSGTTDAGDIVIGPDPPGKCPNRWLFDPASTMLRKLPDGKSVVTLFSTQ
jgi:hypothetical protein